MCFEFEFVHKIISNCVVMVGYYLSNIVYTNTLWRIIWECENQFLVHLFALTDVDVEKL